MGTETDSSEQFRLVTHGHHRQLQPHFPRDACFDLPRTVLDTP